MPAERRLPAVSCAIALALACATSPAPPDRFYRVEISHGVDAEASRTPLDGALEVGPLRSDALTGERAILYVETERPNRVRPHTYDYWVEAPAAMLQQQLLERLRADGVAPQVLTPEMRVPARYRLRGRVNHFERQLGSAVPSVLVELRLEVIDTETRALRLAHTYRATAAARSEGIEDAVEAFDRAVADVYERFVADLTGS